MAGRVGCAGPFRRLQGLREARSGRPQESILCTCADSAWTQKRSPDTPLQMPRVHSVPGRGREGKPESCFDLGGRGNPMQGKCLLEPVAAAEAGRQNKDLWRLEQGLRLGVEGRQPGTPASKCALWFSLGPSRPAPALCTAQYWPLLRLQMNLAFFQHHR